MQIEDTAGAFVNIGEGIARAVATLEAVYKACWKEVATYCRLIAIGLSVGIILGREVLVR